MGACMGRVALEGFHLIYEPSRIATLITKVLFPGSNTFNFVVARFLSFVGKVVTALFGVSKFKAESSFYSILAINGILIILRASQKNVYFELIFSHFCFPFIQYENNGTHYKHLWGRVKRHLNITDLGLRLAYRKGLQAPVRKLEGYGETGCVQLLCCV